MLSKLAVSTLFASLALASPLALPAAFAEAMANPQLPGSTVECHAFCGNAILKWRECGGNSDAATKECTCAPDSEYTQLIHPCLQCGESLWYAYSKFLEESLLLCGLPTAPTGTVVTSAAPATSAPASSSIEPPAQSTTAAPQSSLAPEPSSEPAPIASSSAPGSVAPASSEPASTPASVAPGSTAPVSSVESSAAPGSSAIQSSAQSAPASESSEVEPSSVASSVIGGTSSFHVPSPQITETAYFTNGTTVTDKVTLTTCESCTKSTRSTITYTATITKTDSDGKHAVVTETVTYCPEDGVPSPLLSPSLLVRPPLLLSPLIFLLSPLELPLSLLSPLLLLHALLRLPQLLLPLLRLLKLSSLLLRLPQLSRPLLLRVLSLLQPLLLLRVPSPSCRCHLWPYHHCSSQWCACFDWCWCAHCCRHCRCHYYLRSLCLFNYTLFVWRFSKNISFNLSIFS